MDDVLIAQVAHFLVPRLTFNIEIVAYRLTLSACLFCSVGSNLGKGLTWPHGDQQVQTLCTNY